MFFTNESRKNVAKIDLFTFLLFQSVSFILFSSFGVFRFLFLCFYVS